MADPIRLLLIDDDAADRAAVRRGLAEANLDAELREVPLGEAGIAAFRQERFDCVLLDYQLPDLDGLTILRRLLEIGGVHATVIVLTGKQSERLPVALMQAGATDFLSKDEITPSVLARAIVYGMARQQFRARLQEEITARRRAEEETRQLNERLTATNAELETFCYSVSHDLRAPLRSIDGFTQALVEDCFDRLDAVGRSYLHRILGASDRMRRLIDNLLQLSRVGSAAISGETVDLTDIARSVADELVRSHPGRRVEFEVEDGLQVEGNPSLLLAAMQNLLHNAWKFSGKREQARVRFGRAAASNGVLTFFVRDNGIGFEPGFSDRLGVPFQRSASASGFEGTGIGLATVQRIVRRHGGRLWADGELGEGATFYFTLHEEAAAEERSAG